MERGLGGKKIGVAHPDLPGALKIRGSAPDIARMEASQREIIVKLKGIPVLQDLGLEKGNDVIVTPAVKGSFRAG
jgi:hypothetical protein